MHLKDFKPNLKMFSALIVFALVVWAVKKLFVTEYEETVVDSDGSAISVKGSKVGWKGLPFGKKTTSNDVDPDDNSLD